MNSNSLKLQYNISDVNDALDELGMLSTITQSRKEYIEEGDKFLNRLECLNMSAEQAGPSEDKHKTDSSDRYKVAVVEKENSSLGDFHILTMNSQFITSFNAGYSFPFTELLEKSKKKLFKSNNIFRKRKCRSHPYDIRNHAKVVECKVESPGNVVLNANDSASRLRTASLSSGTSNSKKLALERLRDTLNSTSRMQRSRSMEDLKGSEEVPEKTKDIDYVSRGIQELHMEDCT